MIHTTKLSSLIVRGGRRVSSLARVHRAQILLYFLAPASPFASPHPFPAAPPLLLRSRAQRPRLYTKLYHFPRSMLVVAG